MKNSKEITYLNYVVKMYEKMEMPFIFKPLMHVIFVLVFSAFLIIAKMYYLSGAFSTVVFMVLVLFAGFFLAMYIFYKLAYRSWFYLKPHVDIESINQHLSKNEI